MYGKRSLIRATRTGDFRSSLAGKESISDNIWREVGARGFPAIPQFRTLFPALSSHGQSLFAKSCRICHSRCLAKCPGSGGAASSSWYSASASASAASGWLVRHVTNGYGTDCASADFKVPSFCVVSGPEWADMRAEPGRILDVAGPRRRRRGRRTTTRREGPV